MTKYLMLFAVLMLMIACSVPEEPFCDNDERKVESGIASECVEGMWVTRRITKQWGTEKDDYDKAALYGNRMALDSAGNIYVTGYTYGDLDENKNAGFIDASLVKWNADGTKAWSKLWGTDEQEKGVALTIDTLDNIYVAGYTVGSLDGNANAGEGDIFLTKWNESGTKEWTKQLGTNEHEESSAVIVDAASNVYVTGWTRGSLDGNTHDGRSCGESDDGAPLPCGDIFLTKWDKHGTKIWTRQWGSSGGNEGRALGVDSSGNIYVTGWVGGSLDGNPAKNGPDVFLTKWNTDGEKQWSKQWGSDSGERGASVFIDYTGNIYVSGKTCGEMSNEYGPTLYGTTFLTKLHADGDIEWTTQWGSYNCFLDVFPISFFAVDNSGDFYVTGGVWNDYSDWGAEHAGFSDVFVIKWDTNGNRLLEKLWGTGEDDVGTHIKIDATGNIYVVGWTNGSIDGNTNIGGNDLFLTQWLTE